jgi:acetyl-CoA C-acetyltransferase
MKKHQELQKRAVYVVDGSRTPFLKAKGPGFWSAADLAVATGKALLNRQPFNPSDIDEVILGSVMPEPDEVNIGRVVALRLGCGDTVPGFTVMRNCASGMQALDDAAAQISSGRSNLILAGGCEAMSRAPLLLNHAMTAWLGGWFAAKSFSQRAGLLTKLRPSFFAPIMAILRGLNDPLVGLNMGQTAEEIAFRFNLTRDDLDQFANDSHHRLLNAYTKGYMTEVTPLIDYKGRVFKQDEGVRGDSTVEKLATLKPYFDKKYGMVTAGNSSQISDGACLLLLASEDAVQQYSLPVLGKIVDTQWSGLDGKVMGLGPVHSVVPLLQRHELQVNDIDAWEINEAFAAQVLGCFAALDSSEYCKKHFGLTKAFGAPKPELVNQDGGAIAAGHPIGASGARIVLHVLETLKRKNQKRGVASICIGGGQGGAMLIEREGD